MFAQFAKKIHMHSPVHFTPHELNVWLKSEYEHHHQKQVEKLQVSHLRELDHHMLSDIGVDLRALYSSHPEIKRSM
jgi:uncharacterized protein YjiS (DUF1127 family)